ncbi:fatty acid desaturase [Variovorax sp. J22P271]|uniref:fatty acid desaturase n=1 Tax=Variovorax davisae TaxID=3053515 RepID=UPI002575A81C|nr:fatty acid desaturase [Variovorax sp. J22P271]MDM0032079.1 fatty acid desaturase [Variovorax sp. J22P271]
MLLPDSAVLSAAIDWLGHGLWDLAWWQVVLYALVTTHITIAAVTIFLHRTQTHRAMDLGPIPSHFFCFWLWLDTGMMTKEWVAIHRKHHAKCETVDDPHARRSRASTKSCGAARSSIAPNRRTRKRWSATATARPKTG